MGGIQPDSDRMSTRRRVIEAYFRDVRRRADILPELDDRGFTSEAMLLTCCRIEALGSKASLEDLGNRQSFVHAIGHFGASEHLTLVHPKQMLMAMDESKRGRHVARAVGKVIGDHVGSLLSAEEAIELLAKHAKGDDLAWLDTNLWKGTLAATAYEQIRNRSVHDGRAIPVTFDKTLHKGEPVPRLDFAALYSELRSIVDGAEAFCLSHPETFG